MEAYKSGATDTAETINWKTFSFGAKSEQEDFSTKNIPSRTYDQARNNPIASALINRPPVLVVGCGIKPNITFKHQQLGISQEKAFELAEQHEQDFNLWAKSTESDLYRTLNFYSIQFNAFRQMLLGGDCFVNSLLLDREGSPFNLKLQLIEGSRIKNPNYEADRANLCGGVELDGFGAPNYYYIQKFHDGDEAFLQEINTWQKVKVFGAFGLRRVMQIWDKKRDVSTRGISPLAPALQALKQIERLDDAHIMNSVVNNLILGFIKSKSGTVGMPGAPQYSGYNSGEGGEKKDLTLKQIGKAFIGKLSQDEEMQAFDTKRPDINVDTHIDNLLQRLTAGVGYAKSEILMKYDASYSAARAEMLKAYNYYLVVREMLNMTLNKPVYDLFTYLQVLNGRLKAPGFLEDPYMRAIWLDSADWLGTGKGHIDELREAQAARERIDIGISNIAKETKEIAGADFYEIHKGTVREKAIREKDGIDARNISN